MRYLIMVHSNPRSRAHWATLTDEQRSAHAQTHYALHDALMDSGHVVVSEGLMDVATAKRVTTRFDGEIVATDGPFAEVKEHLAGFYLVECADMDEAVSIAARVPDAAFNDVEVRPVHDHSLPED